MSKLNIPELLAPAGDLETAQAAFHAGADAVYAGLKQFNARERAVNMELSEMAYLIASARDQGKKVYVTLNTLLKERELPEAASILSRLAVMEPHALIVQDLGIIRMARKYFPSLELHASTQMGIHNSAGVALAGDLGIKRVILERQVTLPEMELIAARTNIELEVFVHGALCCSLSGQCLFSSWMGGASGNRGQCKQPCRRRYYSDTGNGFFFSPQDLYTLDHLARIAGMGIHSLKIEGRLKKPDYVRHTVEAYRMVLNALPDLAPVLKEARRILSQSSGRHWSSGFLTESSMKTLILHDRSGVSGQLCGKVIRKAGNGFLMVPDRPIGLGDSIRVQPLSAGEGVAVTLTRLSIGRKNITKMRAGQEVFVHCDKDVPEHGIVYRISTRYGEKTVKPERLPVIQRKLDLNICVKSNGLTVKLPAHPSDPEFHYEYEFSDAKSHPLTADSLIRDFLSFQEYTFCPGQVTAEVQEGLFLPSSILKKIRKDFWSWAERVVKPEELLGSPESVLKILLNDLEQTSACKNLKVEKTILAGPEDRTAGQGMIRARSPGPEKREETVLPFFRAENDLAELEKDIMERIAKGESRFRITSLFQLEIFKNRPNLKLCVSFPLPVTNSMAVDLLNEYAIGKVQIWVELDHDSAQDLVKHSVLPCEIYTYGHPPVLTTRASIPAEGLIRDDRGREFLVQKAGKGSITFLYAVQPLQLPLLDACSEFQDRSISVPQKAEPSDLNFSREWI